MLARVTNKPISHWHKLYEGLQISPQIFYTAVRGALARRQIPGAHIERIDCGEGGPLSMRREYLRVIRGRLAVDICGAPFGNGFFFSTWVTEAPLSPKLGCIIPLLAIGFACLVLRLFDWKGCFIALPILGVTSWIALVGVREGWLFSEDTLLATPWIGMVYEQIFHPPTYYKTDTTLMFQSAVHNAVMEAIDEVAGTQGLRALSAEERKPTLKDFLR